MNILICIACVRGAGPQLWFGDIFGSVDPGSRLTLLHVLGRQGNENEAERCLRDAREALRSASVVMKTRRGDPAPEIVAELETGDYDLVVLGPNEALGMKRHILGSVANHIVRRAPTSVLIAQQVRPGLEHILICTGGAEAAERVIKTGARLAQALGARATLLHVVTPVASMYTGLEELDESLTELLQTDTPIARHLRHGAEILERHQVLAELQLRYGVVADEIIRESRESDTDLILIGAAKGMAQLKRLILGEVTQQVAESAPRSVLVVKEGLWAASSGNDSPS
jgi:nucleotide-binding universal stress UspA family protein